MSIDKEVVEDLLTWQWPMVASPEAMPADFMDFIRLDPASQAKYFRDLVKDPHAYAQELHEKLGVVSAYLFGYIDSPIYLRRDDELETLIQIAKISLEAEILDRWIGKQDVSDIHSIDDAVDALAKIASSNPSLEHELFPYLRSDASAESFRVFLWNEVMRNEVVDDEVGVLTTGMQGQMKVATASNLWDEVGNGRLHKFHTHWLRRLVFATGGREAFEAYRPDRPWYGGITTNVFNILLTRPGLKYQRYGWFMTNEGWVASHFNDIIAGGRRTGFDSDDVLIYFKAHVAIDPVHTRELVDAFIEFSPMMTLAEIREVVAGARLAVAATARQYDYMLDYLRTVDEQHAR